MVAVFHDWAFKPFPETIVGIQKTGHQKIKNTPQFAEPVLDGSAGEGKPLDALHRLHRPGVLGGVIFDILGLVQNMITEHPPLILLDVPFQQIVRSDRHIVAHAAADSLSPLLRVSQNRQHGEFRGKTANLRLPVENQGSGADHQGGAVVPRLTGVQQQGDDLQGLAQAHIVGQDAAEAVLLHGFQPAVAGFLVIAQH